MPQLLVDQDRRADLVVAVARLEPAHGVLQRPPQALPLGVPEGRPRRHVVEAEEVEGDAQAAVVALLGLLAAPQVAVQLLLRGPDRAVDALEHRPLLVAAPVGAGHAQQGERPDRAGGRHVRAAAQVHERAMGVRRDDRMGLPGRIRGAPQVVQDLHLEGLPALLEERPALGRRQLVAHERVVGLDRGPHAGGDRLEVVGRQRPGQLEVVVEAVADGRPDAQARVGEDPQHRLRHDVRRRVAHRIKGVAGVGVEELLGRPASGGLQDLLVRVVVDFTHGVPPRERTVSP